MTLKQSTAVVLSFGPFVDPTDGVTLVTGLATALDNGSTGIKISKNGGALAARHATVTATTYDAYGQYLVTLDTTDTNALGSLRVIFQAAASCLPVWQDFEVIPAQVYNSLVLGSDLLDANAAQLGGTAQTGADVGGLVATNLNATVSSRLPTSSYTAPDNADIVLIKAKTDNLPAAPAAVGDIPTANQNADALLKRDFTAVSGEANFSVLNALRSLRFATNTGTALNVYKENGSTLAWSAPITTNALALPVTAVTP